MVTFLIITGFARLLYQAAFFVLSNLAYELLKNHRNPNYGLDIASVSVHEVQHAKIANTLEYGKSGQPPKPFLKPAKSKSRRQVMAAMTETLEREMNDV